MVHSNIKHNYKSNMFHHLAEEHNEGGRGSDIVIEGSVLDASSSRCSRMRYPVTLTPEILAMLDRYEPDKATQVKLLTGHLASQRTLPSTEEEL